MNKPYLIVDSHLDLAWNALQWNRNLLDPVHTIRAQESQMKQKARGQGTVALPDLHQGRVMLCFATILARSTGQPVPHLDYLSHTQSYGIAQGQLAYYRALEREGHVRIITHLDSLNHHIAEWKASNTAIQPDLHVAPPLGLVISMEGADPITGPP